MSISISGLGKTAFPEGRMWLYIGKTLQQVLHFEWHFGKTARHCGATVTLNSVDGDDGIRLSIGIPFLFGVYFTIEHMPNKWRPGHWAPSVSRPGEVFYYPEMRSMGVRIFDNKIWVSLWENEHEWSHTDPWWWKFTISPIDILFGKENYSSKIVSTGRTIVPMPEHDYAATFKISHSTRKRPRWPWANQKMYVEIENDEPIPLPGKGTTSYNCDDDACYCTSKLFTGSVEDAAAEYAYSIVQDRMKLCGRTIYP